MSKILKSITKLLRVKNYAIESVRQKIAFLNQQIELRYKEIEKNIGYINSERLIATTNVFGADTFGAFSIKKIKENTKYEAEINDLSRTINEIENELLILYKEVKQLEKIQKNETNKYFENQKRLENIEINEIAVQKFFQNNFKT